jgi:hypothetical protein
MTNFSFKNIVSYKRDLDVSGKISDIKKVKQEA